MRDARDARNMIISATAEGNYEFFDESIVSNNKENLKEITDIIEQHPETQFNIYIPPFSILYWELEKLEGRMNWILNEYADSIQILSAYPNVTIYSFVDEKWIIEDLDLYRDTGHYAPSINNYIVSSIMEGNKKTDYHTFKMDSEKFVEFLDKYDFEALWKDK